MFSEERYQIILKALEEKGAVTVQELTVLTQTSESTIRRDLTAMQQSGLLNKVHGGATALDMTYNTHEDSMAFKKNQYSEEKKRIGQYAAGFVSKGDYVYIDAGTTTEAVIDFLNEKEAVYVTNGIGHADKLIRKGYTVYVPGGRVRRSTDAIVGELAIENLKAYHFSVGFFGTNGISEKAGFTTPNVQEASVKRNALCRCHKAFVLADASKFNQIAPVAFGELRQATVVTTTLIDRHYKNIMEVVEVDA